MAKTTGIVRKVDELGRFVLPMELRRTFNIEDKDFLEIFVDGDRIILRKFEPCCVFCGDDGSVEPFKGKNICSACRSAIAERAS